MTNEEKKRDWTRAYSLGEQARRAGKKLSDNPFNGDWRSEPWEDGFESEDARRRA